MTDTIRPRPQQLVDQPGAFDSRLRALPGYDRIEPYRAQILTKAGELVGSTSAFLFAALSATTRATALFIFHFFVLLYSRSSSVSVARWVDTGGDHSDDHRRDLRGIALALFCALSWEAWTMCCGSGS